MDRVRYHERVHEAKIGGGNDGAGDAGRLGTR